MKKFTGSILIILLAFNFSSAQPPVNSKKFFAEETIVEMTLATDIKKLQGEKRFDIFQVANVSMKFNDSTTITEEINVGARGHFRREYCYIPPIMMKFNNPNSKKISPLGKLKLVIACANRADDEQLLLKEFLVYKIYNLLDDKSFRVRLIRMNLNDIRGRMKPFSQYAFLMEDDKALAQRNGCVTKEKAEMNTENTDRDQMTMVAVFEYMISNGDWSVPNNHNIKLIYKKDNPRQVPFVVPYDFDHSGFVNADYALPNVLLGTETVTERVYRGFPRTMEELEKTFESFYAKKDAIYALINNFTFLKERARREAISFLDDFYKTINNKKLVQQIFIDNARTR